jgi:hypothetical protein
MFTHLSEPEPGRKKHVDKSSGKTALVIMLQPRAQTSGQSRLTAAFRIKINEMTV